MLKRNLIIRASAYTRSGYGAHARDIIRALWESNLFNIRLLPTGWGNTSLTDVIDLKMMDILHFCSSNTALGFEDSIFVHLGIPTEFQKLGKYNVGITAGIECETLPAKWVEGCNAMDLVIVPSKFTHNVFITSGVTSKVVVCPEGVDTEVFSVEAPIDNSVIDSGFFTRNPISTTPKEINTDFNFLLVGQWLPYDMGADRKQIALSIKTFIDTFRYVDNVGLIVKTFTTNTDTPDAYITLQRLEDILRTYDDKEGIPPIYLIHGDLTDVQLSSLYRHPTVKGFFTLTSGEGWGRSLAEAVSCGLPVIAPNWSSYLDFVGDKSSILLPVIMQSVPSIIIQSYRGMFPNNARWAMVSEDKAGEGLKKLKHNYDKYKNEALKYAPVFQEKFNLTAAYKPLIDVLVNISPGAVEKISNLRMVKM